MKKDFLSLEVECRKLQRCLYYRCQHYKEGCSTLDKKIKAKLGQRKQFPLLGKILDIFCFQIIRLNAHQPPTFYCSVMDAFLDFSMKWRGSQMRSLPITESLVSAKIQNQSDTQCFQEYVTVCQHQCPGTKIGLLEKEDLQSSVLWRPCLSLYKGSIKYFSLCKKGQPFSIPKEREATRFGSK